MASFEVRSLAPEVVERLVRDMNEQGYAGIAGFFPAATIAEARQWVTRELAKHNGEYFSYIGRDAVKGSLMAALGGSPGLRRLLAEIYERGIGRPAPASGLFQVLRVLAGGTGLKQSYQFHYDAYVVTALVPIAIPEGEGEARGDLVIYPRLRSIRRNVVVNLVEKMLLQNALARRAAASGLVRRLLGAKLLRMVPGDIYFFWGYQSLHGNEPCAPASLRSTALFHFADPHENSPAVALIQGLRRRHEQRIRDRAVARPLRRAS